MEKNPFPNKTYRDSIAINPLLQKQLSFQTENSIKKITAHKLNNAKRKSTFKSIPSGVLQKTVKNFDFIKQKQNMNNDKTTNNDNESDQSQSQHHNTIQLQKLSSTRQKPKGVRFRDRISIQNRNSQQLKKQKMLIDISNEEKLTLLHNIIKTKTFNLPMTSRRRTNQNMKLISQLMNMPVQSKSTIVHELKLFMCHYPEQNSVLFGKKMVIAAKEKLNQINALQKQDIMFFRYEAFGYFLKTLVDLNYDSLQTITAYEVMMSKYTYPPSVKLMLYYMGSYMYQLNNLYEKAEDALSKLFGELMKWKMYDLVGVYLMMIVKLKANLLEWETATSYLTKLLAYAWLYRFQNLEVWVYFQLARGYFFLGQNQEAEYFKTRSEMSIIEPHTNIYRQLVAKQFKIELQSIRLQHKPFDLSKRVSISELIKLPQPGYQEKQERDNFKLQSQIKSINEHCKIKYVKNLLTRMHTGQATQRNSSEKFISGCNSSRNLAGNPLLRTHESGLKNLKIYFRKNPKGQSLLNKNRQPKLYTFQNSGKNILVLKQMCRNILLQMKWFVPINIHEN